MAQQSQGPVAKMTTKEYKEAKWLLNRTLYERNVEGILVHPHFFERLRVECLLTAANTPNSAGRYKNFNVIRSQDIKTFEVY